VWDVMMERRYMDSYSSCSRWQGWDRCITPSLRYNRENTCAMMTYMCITYPMTRLQMCHSPRGHWVWEVSRTNAWSVFGFMHSYVGQPCPHKQDCANLRGICNFHKVQTSRVYTWWAKAGQIYTRGESNKYNLH
jgi:hypothetical protein